LAKGLFYIYFVKVLFEILPWNFVQFQSKPFQALEIIISVIKMYHAIRKIIITWRPGMLVMQILEFG